MAPDSENGLSMGIYCFQRASQAGCCRLIPYMLFQGSEGEIIYRSSVTFLCFSLPLLTPVIGSGKFWLMTWEKNHPSFSQQLKFYK